MTDDRLRDSQVVHRVLAGETDGFRELVERYQARVYGIALRVVGNRAEAEDLTQHSFLEAFRGLASFDSARSFSTWLFSIAMNNCRDYLKSHKRREHQLVGEVEPGSAMFSGRIQDPDEVLNDRERVDLLGAALARLDPKYRIPLVLKDVEGLSYNEIEQVLGLPVTTLKIRVVRARDQLQEQLKPWIARN